MTRIRVNRYRKDDRGFTAVEIAMVATVIAILSLLILPLFRNRVEEARLAAANDELASIAKAQLLVEADTGIFVRLQDLDNNGAIRDALNNPPGNYSDVVPYAAWNGTLETVIPTSRDTIATNWQGPYLTFKRSRSVAELLPLYGLSTRADANEGYIYVVGAGPFEPNSPDGFSEAGTVFIQQDRYPVDPWLNPYFFYGSTRYPFADASESTFNYNVVYSMGPNGLPGSVSSIISPPTNEPFDREVFVNSIGTSDDLEYRF